MSAERHNSTDAFFRWKIAMFNTVGFLVHAGLTTYVDARLPNRVIYGARHYPLGYWVCLLAVPVFFAGLWGLKSKTLWARILVPISGIVCATAIALWNFRPEFPHLNVGFWMGLYALVSLISCWIRFSDERAAFLSADDISPTAKIERIKEMVTVWRTIALSLAIGYIAGAFQWVKMDYDLARQLIAGKTGDPLYEFQVQRLIATNNVQLMLFSAYVVAGVLYESFRKSKKTADQPGGSGR